MKYLGGKYRLCDTCRDEVREDRNEARAKSAKTGWRKITVSSRLFYYRIGRGYIAARPHFTPVGNHEPSSLVADLSEVTGRDPSVLERGKWKKTSDGAVTPADVERWIQRIWLKAAREAALEKALATADKSLIVFTGLHPHEDVCGEMWGTSTPGVSPSCSLPKDHEGWHREASHVLWGIGATWKQRTDSKRRA